MAELRDLIQKQQISTPPANRNAGVALIQKSLERIEAVETEVLPAIDNNSVKMLSELKKHTRLLESILDLVRSESSKVTSEDKQEAQRVIAQQAKAIDKIEENTRPAEKAQGDGLITSVIKETGLGMAFGAVAGDILHQGGNKGNTSEDRQEAKRVVEKQAKTIDKIEENTRPTKPSGDKKDKDFRLGGIGTALAAAIGGIIAAFKAQIKTIQLFAKALLPESWLNALRKKTASFISGLSMQLDLAKSFVAEKFNVARKFLSSVLDSVKAFFTSDGAVMSTIRKIFDITKKVFTTLAEPFVSLYKYIKKVASFTDTFSPITKAIGSVSKWASTFASTVSRVSKILGKIFLPLNIILTLWDTVKGVYEGFQKEGIVGALSGAVKGFVNSLIMAPLDLLKSAVSWVVGAFGFEKIEKMLDSFSFEEMFNKIVDAIFHPIDSLGKLMDGLGEAMDTYIVQPLKDAFKPITDFFSSLKDSILGALQSIHIPEISFTIPIVDKKVSIGPFYPFGKPGSSGKSSSSAPDAAPAANGQQAQPSSSPALASPEKAPTPAQPQVVPRSGQVAQPAIAVSAPAAGAANNVYTQSAQNASAAQLPAGSGGNVVVAPTTNISNKTTNNIVRIPSRNNDPTLNEYYKSRYAF